MPVTIVPIQIPAGSVLSSAGDATSGNLIAIVMPDYWHGTYLSFQISFIGPDGPYYDVYDADGNEIVVAVQPKTVVIKSINLSGWIKIRSGPSERSTPQHQECNFSLILSKGPVADAQR